MSRLNISKSWFLLIGCTYSILSIAKASIEPSLSLSQNWTSNSLLSPSGQDKSDWITEITPKLKITDEKSPESFINYQLQSLYYMHHTKQQQLYHQGQFKGSYPIHNKRANLTLLGAYTQQILDPASEHMTDNRVGSRLPDVMTMSVIPNYHYEKGAVSTQLVLNQSHSKFFHTTQPNTMDTQCTVAHWKKRKIGPHSYQFTANWRKTDLGINRGTLKKNIEEQLSVPIVRSIWLLQKLGYEQIEERANVFQKETGPHIKAGFGYFPTETLHWIFLGGRTPQGHQYETTLSSQTDHTQIQLSLSEEILNSAQMQIDTLQDVVTPINQNTFNLQLPFMSDTFKSHKSNFVVSQKNGTVFFSFQLANQQQTTLYTQQNLEANGAGGFLEWQWHARRSVQLKGSWQKQRLLAGLKQNQWFLMNAYQYQMLPKQSLILQFQHFQNQPIAQSKISENQLSLKYSIAF